MRGTHAVALPTAAMPRTPQHNCSHSRHSLNLLPHAVSPPHLTQCRRHTGAFIEGCQQHHATQLDPGQHTAIKNTHSHPTQCHHGMHGGCSRKVHTLAQLACSSTSERDSIIFERTGLCAPGLIWAYHQQPHKEESTPSGQSSTVNSTSQLLRTGRCPW